MVLGPVIVTITRIVNGTRERQFLWTAHNDCVPARRPYNREELLLQIDHKPDRACGQAVARAERTTSPYKKQQARLRLRSSYVLEHVGSGFRRFGNPTGEQRSIAGATRPPAASASETCVSSKVSKSKAFFPPAVRGRYAGPKRTGHLASVCADLDDCPGNHRLRIGALPRAGPCCKDGSRDYPTHGATPNG